MAGSRKILIVDDERDLLDSLGTELATRGYAVLKAGDGIAALEAARSEGPDLILLDLMLPHLDGYRILQLLKKDERYRKIPILVITARANAEDWTLAMECGADGCLTKPFCLDSLLDRIVAIIGNGSGNGNSRGNGNGDLSHGEAAAA